MARRRAVKKEHKTTDGTTSGRQKEHKTTDGTTSSRQKEHKTTNGKTSCLFVVIFTEYSSTLNTIIANFRKLLEHIVRT